MYPVNIKSGSNVPNTCHIKKVLTQLLILLVTVPYIFSHILTFPQIL